MGKLYMRWSDGNSLAVPFPVEKPEDITTGLVTFRGHSDQNGHLHVFVPNSAGTGDWVDVIHREHIVSPGTISQRVNAHPEHIMASGLISEAIRVFDPALCGDYIAQAQKTLRIWDTSGGVDYSDYAMRDSLSLLRQDLIANLRHRSGDDLIPHPDEENNLVVLKQLAVRYGLIRDFNRAYPV